MTPRFGFAKFQRVPKPWAAIAHLMLMVGACLLFAGRSLEALRPDLVLGAAPGFYTHVSNFFLSYLLVTGVGYMWQMFGLGLRPIVLLGLAVMLCNLVYESFVPVLNTPDPVDAYYGLVGAALGLALLGVIDRYGMIPNPAG